MDKAKKIFNFIFVFVLVLLTYLFVNFKIINNIDSSKNISKNIQKINYLENNKDVLYQFFSDLGIKYQEDYNIDEEFNNYVVEIIEGKDSLISRDRLKEKLNLDAVDESFYKKTTVEEKIERQFRRYEKQKKFSVRETFEKINLNLMFSLIIIVVIILLIVINLNLKKTIKLLSNATFLVFILNLLTVLSLNLFEFTGNLNAKYLNNKILDYKKLLEKATIYNLFILITLIVILIILNIYRIIKCKKEGIVTADNFLNDYDEVKVEEKEIKEEKKETKKENKKDDNKKTKKKKTKSKKKEVKKNEKDS